jgi:hypothetical protein
LTGTGCTSWPSSNTPPAGYGFSAPPPIRLPRGSPRRPGTWSWISTTPGARSRT